MPGKSNAEKALEKARNKQKDAEVYASYFVDKEGDSRVFDTKKNINTGKKLMDTNTYEYQTAHDAARRHYRRHVAKEMAELLESYEPQYIDF